MRLVKRSNYLMPEFNHLFDNVLGRDYFLTPDKFFNQADCSQPLVNVKESNDDYVVEVAAPGLKKDQFNVTVENGILTISATQNEEQKQNEDAYTSREFHYSSFERSFRLPKNKVDESSIKANYHDGILEVFIAKKEEVKPKPKRLIKIM
jgi:HSP20 family protein